MYWTRLREFIRVYLLAFVAAFILILLTVLTFQELYTRVYERNATLFSLRTDAARIAIEKRMNDYVQILKGAQGLFMIADTVNQEEWREYFSNLNIDENYPGIQGIGFSVFVPREDLYSFEEKVRQKGISHFTVWPEGEREVYSTILYLEPHNARNMRAIGYDMFSDSTRREAMEHARDTGMPALSGSVTLVQETNEAVQRGFNLYLPLYKSDSLQAVEERRQQISGYVYSPFRIHDLMRGILGTRFQELDIEIYEMTDNGQKSLLFDSNEHEEEELLPGFLKINNIDIGGRSWRIYFRAMPDFGYDTTFPWFVLVGGILISSLIFVVMYSLANIRRSTYLKQLITDNATAGLFILDKKDYSTFANPAAEALTGYSFEELQKNSLHQLVHHSHPDGSPFPPQDCPIIKALKEEGVLRNHESIFIRRGGEKIHVSINAQPIYDSTSIVAHLLEVRDISQEKKAELRLRENNRNLQTLNNIGKNLLAELELKKLLQQVTDSCTELTSAQLGAFFYNAGQEGGDEYMLYAYSGEQPEAFLQSAMPLNSRVFAPAFDGALALRSDDITLDERYGKNAPIFGLPEGHLPVKSYLAVPVISRNGEVLGGLFFGHTAPGVFSESSADIVKGVAAQAAIAIDNSKLFEAIRHKNEELIKINNDLDNFVYTASHDLKAPVLNIEGLVYALRAALQKNKPERIEEILNMVQVSVAKFKETIQALTEVARTNKILDEEIEVLNLEELLDDVLLSIQDSLDESGAEIHLKLDCKHVRFSKVNMRSVLLNLVSNAIKYRSHQRAPKVCISCQRNGSGFELKVSDNGLGIAENHLSKIFNMFRRYHTHVEGTGIGLYLVKRIVENNGGSIVVESKPDEGTSFTIRLPEAS